MYTLVNQKLGNLYYLIFTRERPRNIPKLRNPANYIPEF